MTDKDDAVYPNNYYEQYEPQWGLTKREYFAAMAMQGLVSAETSLVIIDEVCTNSVKIADALLGELAK